MELIDPQVQQGKIQGMVRYWVGQLTAVINGTTSRSILAGAANLSNVVNLHQLIFYPRISVTTNWQLTLKTNSTGSHTNTSVVHVLVFDFDNLYRHTR